jgi:hypothetical protein
MAKPVLIVAFGLTKGYYALPKSRFGLDIASGAPPNRAEFEKTFHTVLDIIKPSPAEPLAVLYESTQPMKSLIADFNKDNQKAARMARQKLDTFLLEVSRELEKRTHEINALLKNTVWAGKPPSEFSFDIFGFENELMEYNGRNKESIHVFLEPQPAKAFGAAVRLEMMNDPETPFKYMFGEPMNLENIYLRSRSFLTKSEIDFHFSNKSRCQYKSLFVPRSALSRGMEHLFDRRIYDMAVGDTGAVLSFLPDLLAHSLVRDAGTVWAGTKWAKLENSFNNFLNMDVNVSQIRGAFESGSISTEEDMGRFLRLCDDLKKKARRYALKMAGMGEADIAVRPPQEP